MATSSSTPSSEYEIREDSIVSRPVLIVYRRGKPILTVWIGDIYVNGVRAEDVKPFYPDLLNLLTTMQTFDLPYVQRAAAMKELIKEKLDGLRADQ